MKIKKSYLQQIINEELFRQLAKEELLKELMGPPKKPPTKIRPKTKPKPLEKSITFYYLLDDSSGNSQVRKHQFSSDEIKKLQESVFYSKETSDEEKFLKLAYDLVYVNEQSKYYVMGLGKIKSEIIPMIPEIASLKAERYEPGYTQGVDDINRPFDTMQTIPKITVDKGQRRKTYRYDYENREIIRGLGDYNIETLLKYLWIDKFGVKENPEKYLDIIPIEKIKEYKKFIIAYMNKTEDRKNNAQLQKNYSALIDSLDVMIKKYGEGDNVKLRKYLYIHGFVPLSIVMTGIQIPVKDKPDEIEVVDAVGQYFNRTFKLDGLEEPDKKRDQAQNYINKLLTTDEKTGLKLNKNVNKKEKIIKKADTDTSSETDQPEEDPISDFNQMLKGILPSDKEKQK